MEENIRQRRGLRVLENLAVEEVDTLDPVKLKKLRRVTMADQMTAEQRLKSKQEADKIEKAYREEMEERAALFTSYMEGKTSEQDRRREGHLAAMKERNNKIQKVLWDKRMEAQEAVNQEKREMIKAKMDIKSVRKLISSQEVSRRHEEYLFVRDTLSPPMDKERQKKVFEEREEFAEDRLAARRSFLHKIQFGDIQQHEKEFLNRLNRRSMNESLRKMNGSLTLMRRPSFVVGPSPDEKKQQRSNHLQHKSQVYVQQVQKKVDMRSSKKAINEWEKYKNKINFGFYFKKEIDQKKTVNMSMSPEKFLLENKAKAKQVPPEELDASLPSISKRFTSPAESPEPKREYVPFKDFKAKNCDLKKVNNEQLLNKELNLLERKERAKKNLQSGPKKAYQIDGRAEDLERLAERMRKKRDHKAFDKIVAGLEVLDKQAVQRDRMEKAGLHRKVDSIDLYSQAIKAKLQLLK